MDIGAADVDLMSDGDKDAEPRAKRAVKKKAGAAATGGKTSNGKAANKTKQDDGPELIDYGDSQDTEKSMMSIKQEVDMNFGD